MRGLFHRRILNKTLLLAIVIDFFYYLGGYFRLLYFSSWVWVVKDYSYGEWTMFNNAMGVGLCAFSLISGAAIRYLQRYKSVQLFGLVFYIVCVLSMSYFPLPCLTHDSQWLRSHRVLSPT